MFIEEFIRLEGISKMMNLMKCPDPFVIQTSLKALSYTFVYLSGVDFLRQRPHLISKLFDLTNHQSVEVKKQALGILIGLCKCMKSAFQCINKAAINTARRVNQSPYANLLNSLGLPDIDLKINILTLINWMMFKCPSERKMAKFIARMENLGIYDDLRALAKEKNQELVN